MEAMTWKIAMPGDFRTSMLRVTLTPGSGLYSCGISRLTYWEKTCLASTRAAGAKVSRNVGSAGLSLLISALALAILSDAQAIVV